MSNKNRRLQAEQVQAEQAQAKQVQAEQAIGKEEIKAEIKAETTATQTPQDMIKEMADKIEALVAGGKTMAEALAEVVPLKATRTRIDRIAYIESLDNLKDLRSARKTAYAKKSKAKGKPEAEARYNQEIEVATRKLNELASQINSATYPWKKALELGDTPEGALQFLIQDLEQESKAKLDYLTKAMDPVPTKAEIKTFVAQSKVATDFIPEELRAAFRRRLESRDQRVYTLAQRMQAIEDLTTGARKFEPKPAPEKSRGKKDQDSNSDSQATQ